MGAVAQGSVYALPTTAPLRRRKGEGSRGGVESGARATGPQTLTRREVELIKSWIRHGVNKLVAHELGISEQTAKNHITRIMAKLDAASMGQAAVRYDRWARDQGLDRRSGFERRSARDRRRP